MSALFLSAPEQLAKDPNAFQGVTGLAFESATRVALAYDALVQKNSNLRMPPSPPIPAPGLPQFPAGSVPGKNADGTPFVWDRPSPDLVRALSFLRGIAEEPPKTVEELATKIAPIQQFLTDYDNAQPRL